MLVRIRNSYNKISLFVDGIHFKAILNSESLFVPSLEFIIFSFRLKCALLYFIHVLCVSLLSYHSKQGGKQEEDVYLLCEKTLSFAIFASETFSMHWVGCCFFLLWIHYSSYLVQQSLHFINVMINAIYCWQHKFPMNMMTTQNSTQAQDLKPVARGPQHRINIINQSEWAWNSHLHMKLRFDV